MPTSPNHTFGKPSNLNYLFSKLFPLDRPKGGEIGDDWEMIDYFDSKNACEGDGSKIQEEDVIDMIEEPYNWTIPSNKRSYTYLTKADVLQLLGDMITIVSTVLFLERKKSALLLQHFKWDVNRTCDEWLECEEKVCKKVGLFMKPVAETPANAAEITCGICYTDFPGDAMFSVSCGHQICCSCWEGYIEAAVNIGPQCLTLRCPKPSCDAAVDFYLIKHLLSEDDNEKFENHLLRSYLACSNEGRWCPAPGCNYAVFSSNGEEDNVTCRCLHSFCWDCSGEAHAPVDCNTLTQWMSELTSQSENWLLASTTTCPKCTVKFDKGSNTSYEECPTCGHKYCSVCGDDWKDPDPDDLLGLFSTHSCEPDNDQKRLYEISLKYNRCYTEWATCEASRANALTEYKIIMELKLELLCVMFGISPDDLDFLSEALLQVVKYWQFLKWTHVYGYYLPASEDVKKKLLEFLQDDAARHLRRAQKQIEELLEDFLEKACPSAEFWRFRNQIVYATSVARNYFDRLMEGVKAGLSEVGSRPNPSLKHKMSGDDEEGKGCSGKGSTQHLNSPSLSPTAKIMRLFDDMDIRGPVGYSKPADFCIDFSPPELKAKPKVD